MWSPTFSYKFRSTSNLKINLQRCLNHFVLDFQKNSSQMGEVAIWSKYTSVCYDSFLMEAGRRHKGGGTELSIACRSEHTVSMQLLLNNDKGKKTKKISSDYHSLY